MAYDAGANTSVNATYANATDASVFVPEMWAAGVKGYFEKPTTFLSLADTSLSGLVKAQGDTIHIPKMGAKVATATTPQAISALTANIAYHSPNDTETKLTVNKLAYSAQIIADVVKIQATPELFNMYVEGMGYAIQQDVENYVGDLFAGGTIGNMVESTTASDVDNVFTLADLKTLIGLMYSNGANPRDGYVMVVSPELASHMMTITGFTSADFANSIGVATPGAGANVAAFGAIAGMPLYVSDRFTAATDANTIIGSVFKPSNLKLAYQVDPTVVSQYSVDFLGTKLAAYVAYGATIVDEGQVFGITQG